MNFSGGLFLLEKIGPKNSTQEFGSEIRASKICLAEFVPKFGFRRCKIPCAAIRETKAACIDLRTSALGKWGRTQMGSDGFNRIFTGFYLLDPAGVRPVPSETHDFKGFDRILTGL